MTLQGLAVGQMLPVVVDFFTDRADRKLGGGSQRGQKGVARHGREHPWDGVWMGAALCRTEEADFLANADPEASKVCARCPVRIPCLARALVEERGHSLVEMATTRGGLGVIPRHALR